jgi:DNA-binding PadR family transcriptional regulator
LTSQRGVSQIQVCDPELIKIISQYPNRNAKIRSNIVRLLMLFVTKPYLSTYQIQKTLNSIGQNVKDETIRRRIKKLESLKLIEKLSEEDVSTPRELMHKAAYYRLSEGGIYYLLYKAKKLPFLNPASRRNFILYYGDNVIFRTFLYPYIEKQTFLDLKGIVIIQEIFQYLIKCCATSDKTISSIEKFKGEQQWTVPLFDWNSMPG